MKHEQAIRRLILLRGWIRDGATSGATCRAVDEIIDRLERVMPGLPEIGVVMLIVVACASCGWIDLGLSDAARQAQEAAQDDAVLEAPGSIAF